jgi:hypothetical protein
MKDFLNIDTKVVSLQLAAMNFNSMLATIASILTEIGRFGMDG